MAELTDRQLVTQECAKLIESACQRMVESREARCTIRGCILMLAEMHGLAPYVRKRKSPHHE
jgi:hypothetical protein